MSIDCLLEPIGRKPGPVILTGAQEWMQGRTLYGGASALIAYTAVTRALSDLPPLRAAQIAFVAPLGETVETRVKLARRGRNVTQVRADILTEGKLGLTAFMLFGAAREPNALYPAPLAQNLPPPSEQSDDSMSDRGPAFIRKNFELRRAQEQRGPGAPVVRRWIRLTAENTLDPIAQLVLLGDTLPPGAMRAMRRPGPISSINWSFNILDAAPETRDGWWLAETASDHADEGFSSERLRLWNAAGELMMVGMQSAALFG